MSLHACNCGFLGEAIQVVDESPGVSEWKGKGVRIEWSEDGLAFCPLCGQECSEQQIKKELLIMYLARIQARYYKELTVRESQTISLAISALRRLDELEKWLDKQSVPAEFMDSHFGGYYEAVVDMKNILSGDMQMPPEEEKES